MGDGPVHLDDRSWRGFGQDIVQSRDPAPVRVLGPAGASVLGRNRGLQKVLPDRLAARGEQLGLLNGGQSAPDQHRVPSAPVLLLEQDR